ncbi:hypothetical protein LWI29_034711 [Acer saccharum]|uniref:Phosphatidic acid phosphatase type 2/haloperoxidase domain-containing protein n=1 Tax=Acer saccharum TaxID=4024 RepID=A0AA39SYS0_ACESA|nr:hypothetical protein LWI29_034711 [Acer saccharum]
MPWWEFRSLSCVQNLMGFFQVESSRRLDNSANSHHWPLLEYWNKECRMTDVTSGFHSVKSHGTTVARTHLHDWVILLLLGVVVFILNFVHPFYRFVGKDMMYDIKYPFKNNTVPFWAVVTCAIGFPMLAFLIVYFRRRCVYDLHHAILGLSYSLLLTQILTDAIKLTVGRPRPDFFWRCFPDGKDVYDKLGNVICHGKASLIKEGHKSFPSGHTSCSFAGMVFLSLYISGKIQAFDRRGHVAKLCIIFLPLLVATLVGISRVDDYKHHWNDVFAGGLLGLTVATMCYLQFFPLPSHDQGWGPYAYFRALEELGASTHAVNAAQTKGVANDGYIGLQLASDSDSDSDSNSRAEDEESDYIARAEDVEFDSTSRAEDVESRKR